MAYYTANSVYPPKQTTILINKLIEDQQSGVLTKDALNGLLTQLSTEQIKDLKQSLSDRLDIIDPDESILDLLDYLDTI